MDVQTVDANTARLQWRLLIDTAIRGGDTIIERYSKPTAVVIPFEDYAALQEELEELRAGRRAQAAYEEWAQDPTSGEDWESVKAALRSEGRLTDE